MNKLTQLIALSLIASAPGLLVAGELYVADVFADNAVLQQNVSLPVWGTMTAGSQVTVRFAGQTKSARAAPDGTWQVELLPIKSDHNGKMLQVSSGNELHEFRNLVVGEVWYASGQSNMQMTLGACARKIPAIAKTAMAAATSSIRWLRVDEPDSPHPLTRRKRSTGWQLDGPLNRSKQSAVAYFFAHKLHEQLNVPIGIIEGSWGGKPIEGFIPHKQFKTHASLAPIVSLADQDQLEELAKLKGGVIIRNTAGMPGRIFNARVAPIAPYALRGFIWYQGESNAGRGEDPRNYQTKMRALVDGWRETWGQPELPFFFVQLPAYKDEAKGWVRLREEQRRSLNIPKTGMAVTIDLRDKDIHPANKLDVGRRLASWALGTTYGMKVDYSGPLYKSATPEGNSMRVEFQYAESGLMVARKKGIAKPAPTPDVALAHFELADEFGNWHPAKAKIEGSAVVVHCESVQTPRAVRYACSGAPSNANLYNRVGLPASPFCSELQLLPWDSDN